VSVIRFWILEPEVAGELGDGTNLDTSSHPPTVSRLEYRFMGWLGDDLLESFPCHIVTAPLAEALGAANLTGFRLDALAVSVSEEFKELYPGRMLPAFRWLKVHGEAGVDDFGLSPSHSLVVSEAALRVLRQYTLSQCEVRALT
jgi:hypothetical protein